jgi:hypothetical protein
MYTAFKLFRFTQRPSKEAANGSDSRFLGAARVRQCGAQARRLRRAYALENSAACCGIFAFETPVRRCGFDQKSAPRSVCT